MENKIHTSKTFLKNKEEIRGLGDWVEKKITEPTGIKRAVELLTKGKDCGCKKRQEKLNNLVPFKRK